MVPCEPTLCIPHTLATAVFLRINGYVMEMPDDEAFTLAMAVAAGQLDADGIHKQLRLAQALP